MSFTPSISTSGPVLDPAAGPITGSDQTNTSSSGLPSQSCNVLPAGAGIRSASAANGNLSASTPGAQANPGDGKLADCTEKWWPASFTQLYDKLTVLEVCYLKTTRSNPCTASESFRVLPWLSRKEVIHMMSPE